MTYPEVRRETVPDEGARRDPRHRIIADALTYAATPHITLRVWGRFVDNTAAGAVGNAWAGTPDDVADTIVRALLDHEARQQEAPT
jgi:hypothetical protein